MIAHFSFERLLSFAALLIPYATSSSTFSFSDLALDAAAAAIPAAADSIAVVLQQETGDDLQWLKLARGESAAFGSQEPFLGVVTAGSVDLGALIGGQDRFLVVVLGEYSNSTWMLRMMREDFARSVSSTWLMEDTPANSALVEEARPPLDSKVFLGSSEDGLLYLTEIYQLESKSVRQRVGPALEVLTEEESSFFDRRSNLQGMSWRVGYTLLEPMTYIDAETNMPSGFHYELWNLLAASLNVSSELVYFDSFGKLTGGSRWGGMVGAVQRGEIDVTMSSVHATFQRSLAVEFLNTVAEVEYVLASTKTEGGSDDHLALVRQDSYIAALTLLLISSATAYLILRWGNSSWKTDMSEVFVLVLGSCINQGMEQDPHLRGLPRRLLFYFHFLFGIVVTAAFSALLTSNLVVKTVSPAVKSFEDVLRLQLNLYIPGGGSTESIFRNAPPGSVRERVWDKILSKSDSFRLPLNSVLFTSFLSDPKGVAFVPAFFVMANMGRDPGKACDLALKRVSLRPFSMIARPGFPYASLLDGRLKALQENGVADWLVKSYLLPVTSEKDYICSRIETDDPESVGIYFVSNFFMVASVGMALAVAVAVGEYITRRWTSPTTTPMVT